LVRITGAKETGISTITIDRPHSCNPTTHQGFAELNSVWYLARHQANIIANNRKATIRDLEAVEEAHFHHSGVAYKQTWRMKNTFGLFPAYPQRFKAAYPTNIALLNLDPDSNSYLHIWRIFMEHSDHVQARL
jgi:hypothetical protein